jgi:hypothetical protein
MRLRWLREATSQKAIVSRFSLEESEKSLVAGSVSRKDRARRTDQLFTQDARCDGARHRNKEKALATGQGQRQSDTSIPECEDQRIERHEKTPKRSRNIIAPQIEENPYQQKHA